METREKDKSYSLLQVLHIFTTQTGHKRLEQQNIMVWGQKCSVTQDKKRTITSLLEAN